MLGRPTLNATAVGRGIEELIAGLEAMIGSPIPPSGAVTKILRQLRAARAELGLADFSRVRAVAKSFGDLQLPSTQRRALIENAVDPSLNNAVGHLATAGSFLVPPDVLK